VPSKPAVAQLAGPAGQVPKTLLRDSLLVMINGTHAIVYASDAEQARAFFRDVLGMPNIDVHDGWLIFKLPPAELGVHPAGDASPSGHHELYFLCDDVEATVTELKAKGVEFTSGIQAAGFGLMTRLQVPGAGEIGLYQPRHALAYELEG
jgi:catechol 2,3-dioxygenase-like lactoylglutathione lyase family enzyme